MMKNVLLLFVCSFFFFPTHAQVTILDFESPETSTTFQHFGSTIDGTIVDPVDNPAPGGENESATVGIHVKPAVAETWAGAFSNPDPSLPVDLTGNQKIAIKVFMDHLGSVSLKLENSPNGGSNWVITVPNTKVNEWETLIFDPTIPSIEAPNAPAAGFSYARVVLFFDFGNAGTGEDVVSYFDDLQTLAPPPTTVTILDFEDTPTSTVFQYFGSSLDGTFTQVVTNPLQEGINTSNSVTEFIKPIGAQTWAGAFSNPGPETPVTIDAGTIVCIDVLMDHIGNLTLKLENSATGPNWVTTVANTLVGEWEKLCFDPTAPSIEAPFEPASGVYTTVTLFFDFGSEVTDEDVVSYFDNIVTETSGAPSLRVVTFRVDMNNYTENFDNVYISGSFNNWAGDANELLDPDFDGIYEGSIEVVNGAYEYKVTLDNWAVQEEFSGFEECTKVDASGQFVNRLLLISGDTEIPEFCFNSCYDCGNEVLITFRLGFGGEVPSGDGVWLAGGGNFDVPGGKYRMGDDDLDGIYEITVPRAVGFGSFYTFTNGNCPDYSCKESLVDLECGDPDNFNDRTLPPVLQDTIIETCFGTCSTDVMCTTGLNHLTADSNLFSIWGNPSANGSSILNFGDDLSSKNIRLTNAMGQVLKTWQTGDGISSFQIQTSGLQSGMYYVTVFSENKFYTRKLIL